MLLTNIKNDTTFIKFHLYSYKKSELFMVSLKQMIVANGQNLVIHCIGDMHTKNLTISQNMALFFVLSVCHIMPIAFFSTRSWSLCICCTGQLRPKTWLWQIRKRTPNAYDIHSRATLLMLVLPGYLEQKDQLYV